VRNKVLIAALVVIGLIALWAIRSKRPRDQRNEPSPLLQNDVQGATSPAVTQTSSSREAPPTTFQARQKAFTAAFKTPISFYGRVIDQHGDPVPQADVKLSANDKASGGRPSEYTRKTDSDGHFSIGGISGITLAVEVSKPGYRGIPQTESQPSSSGLFEYWVSEAAIRGPHRSTPDAPTTFVLFKPGPTEPLVKVGAKNFRIARDGSPLSISLDQQGGHQIVLRCWNQELTRSPGRRQYDWRLEITVPNGGLIARKDAFEFEAPEGGYLPSDSVDMASTLGNRWRSSAARSYFVHFDDETFGRVELEMQAAGDHFVVWKSLLNPKAKSRNLETTAN
jgi:hypothetical protein